MRAYVSVPDDSEPMVNPLAGVSFTLDGEEFHCNGEPDLLDQSELALLAASATDITRPEAQAAIAAFLQMAFGHAEYAHFKRHTKEHHTRPEVIMDIMAGINEQLEEFVVAASGRPTVPLSPSLPGDAERAAQLSKAIASGAGDITVLNLGQPGGQPKAARKAPSARGGARGSGASARRKEASASGG